MAPTPWTPKCDGAITPEGAQASQLDDGIGSTLVSVDGIGCRRKEKSLDIALELVALVVSGLLNKQVGGELGISEITVKA